MNPSVVLSNPQEQCVTFYWDEMPNYYVGYRFWEGTPKVTDRPIISRDTQMQATIKRLPTLGNVTTSQSSNQSWKNNWQNTYFERDANRANPLSFKLSTDGVAHIKYFGEKTHQYEWYFQPFPQGVRIWAKLTANTEIKGSFCLQHCLRFTGMFNAKWRQAIAHTPFLSELDMQAMGNANGTLTYARRHNEWFSFPVQYVVFPTCVKAVSPFDSNGDLVDNGLIVRESPKRDMAPAWYWELAAPNTSWDQITSGMFWERTVCISNRHPADCIHTWVDFGPLAAGQSRTVRGVVYFIEGTKDDILALWQNDFKMVGNN